LPAANAVHASNAIRTRIIIRFMPVLLQTEAKLELG